MNNKCSSCGAPLAHQATSCGYCKSQVDVDIRGVHTYTRVKPQEPRPCASCKTEMDSINLHLNGDFIIEQCGQCYSLFFDPGELEYVLKHTVNGPEFVNHLKLNELLEQQTPFEEKVQYRPCPVCTKIMNRKNYGARSGVIIDFCKEHGVFLDSGELSRLFQWKKVGGDKHHQKMEKWKSEEDQRRQNRIAADLKAQDQKLSQSYSGQHGNYGNFGSMNMSSSHRNILDDLNGVINFVLKIFT